MSRSALPGTGLLGERYVEQVLAQAGFNVIRPETMSLLDQMRAYRAAEVVVFAEGSACHGVELLGTEMLGTAIMLARREDHMEVFRRVLQPRSRRYVPIPPPAGTMSMFRTLKHLATGTIAYKSLFDTLRAFGWLGWVEMDGAAFRWTCATDFAAHLAWCDAHHCDDLDPVLRAHARQMFEPAGVCDSVLVPGSNDWSRPRPLD